MARESTATLIFSIAGLIGAWISDADWSVRLPTAMFYAVLVLNTFYSVRFFSLLPPLNRDERVIDGVLAIIYIVLAFSIGSVVLFSFVSMMLFAAATTKYILLLGIVERTDILRRKIAIDTLGLALCTATFAGAILGYPLASAWLQAGIFVVANVYLLAIRPMYALGPSRPGGE